MRINILEPTYPAIAGLRLSIIKARSAVPLVKPTRRVPLKFIRPADAADDRPKYSNSARNSKPRRLGGLTGREPVRYEAHHIMVGGLGLPRVPRPKRMLCWIGLIAPTVCSEESIGVGVHSLAARDHS